MNRISLFSILILFSFLLSGFYELLVVRSLDFNDLHGYLISAQNSVVDRGLEFFHGKREQQGIQSDETNSNDGEVNPLLSDYTMGTIAGKKIKGQKNYALTIFCDIQSELCGSQDFQDQLSTIQQKYPQGEIFWKPVRSSGISKEQRLFWRGSYCLASKTKNQETLLGYHLDVLSSPLTEKLIQQVGSEYLGESFDACLQNTKYDLRMKSDIDRNLKQYLLKKNPSFVLENRTKRERVVIPGVYSVQEVTDFLKRWEANEGGDIK